MNLQQFALQPTPFPAFLGSDNAGLIIFDDQLQYVHIDSALANINHHPAIDPIGKRICEVSPDLANILEPIVQAVLDSGEPVVNWISMGGSSSQTDAKHYWLMAYYPLLGQNTRTFGVGCVVLKYAFKIESCPSPANRKP